jgi:hypothetical protein
VVGVSQDGVGTFGQSTTNVGVRGETQSGFAAIHGEHKAGGLAGFFKGKLSVDGDVDVNRSVNVKGDVNLIGADLAEEFGVVGDLEAEPGSVVVLAGDDSVRVSDQPYDHRVAGVVSGAGSFRPGLILDRQSGSGRRPLALTGKVWCKVDADYGAINLGDLLTTSSTPGHAMRAEQKDLAFGAVIGKALGDFPSGRGILPILVTLQ